MMKKIYIIDDDRDFLEIIANVLRKDYTIHCTESFHFLDFQNFAPDLLLIDNKIGNSSAEEVLLVLEKNAPDLGIPVIMISAHPDPRRIAGIERFAGYIQKPAGIREIRQYISDYFSGKPMAIPVPFIP